jgi:hypothetical protein
MADEARTGTDRYALSTAGPVRYRPVTLDGRVIAYLWASTVEDAASCVMVLAAAEPVDRLRTAAAWSDRLGRARREGLTAPQALEHWAGAPEDPVAGAVGGPAREAAGLGEVYALADPGHPGPTAPAPDRTGRAAPDRGSAWGPLSPFTLDERGYLPTTASPVRYVPVRAGDQVVGYLWAAETDDAASFVATVRSGTAGSRAKSDWVGWLVQRRREGTRPLEALRLAVGEPAPGTSVAPDAEEETAPSLRDLERIAWS